MKSTCMKYKYVPLKCPLRLLLFLFYTSIIIAKSILLLQVVGMYSEIGDINGPLSQAIPPPPNDDTVTHFHPDLLQCHDTSVPQPTQPPSNEGSEPDVNEPVKDLDVHPLGLLCVVYRMCAHKDHILNVYRCGQNNTSSTTCFLL